MPNAILRAEFFGFKDLPGLQHVSVRQKTGAHTVVMLDYDLVSNRDFLLPPENTPVAIHYGAGVTGMRSTYGYVNHNEVVSTGGGKDKAFTRLVVLGTSKVMNTVNPQAWMGYSNSGIAREIASRHRMRSVVHSHPFSRETWMSGDRTDFQCLQVLADEIGYQFWVDGSTLWFLDPMRLVQSASTMSTPLIRVSNIKKIKTMGGSNIPGEVEPTKRVVQYGLDRRTKEIFEVSNGNRNAPTALRVGGDDNYSEAKERVDGSSKRQKDENVLRATVAGDARYTPGTLVEFEAGKVNRDQSGLWVVNEANHESKRKGEFLTELVCSRGNAETNRAVTLTTVRDTPSFARAVLRNGKTWEAELQERVHV